MGTSSWTDKLLLTIICLRYCFDQAFIFQLYRKISNMCSENNQEFYLWNLCCSAIFKTNIWEIAAACAWKWNSKNIVAWNLAFYHELQPWRSMCLKHTGFFSSCTCTGIRFFEWNFFVYLFWFFPPSLYFHLIIILA